MHHHRVNTTPPFAETNRLHLGTADLTHQERAPVPGAHPEQVDNPNHHTNA
jgi:hypothetical protein